MENEYPVDVVTSFADYTKFLLRMVPITIPSDGDHLNVVKKVFLQATREQSAQRPDLAFVLFMRLMEIVERAKLKSNKEAANIFMRSVESAEKLKQEDLPKLLAMLNSRVEGEMAERQRTVEMQKEMIPEVVHPDVAATTNNIVEPQQINDRKNENESNEDPALAHERRRQALLQQDPKDVLKNTPLPQSTVTYDSEAAHEMRRQRVLEQEQRFLLERQAKIMGGGGPTAPIRPPPQPQPSLVKVNEPPSSSVVTLTTPSTTVVTAPAASRVIPPPPPDTAPVGPSVVVAPPPVRSSPTPALSVPPAPIATATSTPIAPPRNRTTAVQHRPWNYPQSKPWAQPRRGLVNLGNTCYLNAVTQCLAQTLFGRNFLDDAFYSDLFDTTDRLVASFAFVVRELHAQSTAAVSTSGFKFQCGKLNDAFAGKSQQDANEFLRTVLDGMHESLNKHKNRAFVPVDIQNVDGTDEDIAAQYWSQYKARNSSIVEKFFVHQERSCIECPICHMKARSFAPGMGVELSIPTTNNGRQQQTTNIDDCFQQYCLPEILDQDSLYTCTKCNKKVPASKTLSFHTVPEILVVTLKRFRSYGDFSDKINSNILFGEELDIAPYVTGQAVRTKYRLTGLVYHQGNMHGGHYTCDVLGAVDQAWCRYSDEHLQAPTSPDQKLVYILFYARQ